MAIAEESTASGISFALTDEQSDLRALAHEFAEKEIRPVAAEYDEQQTHPADVIAKAHELGLMNVHIPQELGGPGLSIFDGILIGEELSWGCSGIAVSLVANTLGSAPVLLAGTDEQKQTWLPPLLEEPLLCSFALTEPNAGSDVSGIQTTAERHGDEYVLNGSKMFISNAGHAAWIVVFASTDKSTGQRGLSAFVVPADAEGVTVEKHLDKMGQRATDTSALALQDVKVPAANRLGEEGDGFKIAMRTLDHTRPGTAIGAVGRRPGGLRALGRVLARARPVRPADRDEPGRELPDRGHGRRDRGRAAADLAGGVAARPGQARDPPVVVREAVRVRHGDEGHDRRGADLRRLRVHEGVPGREADARREALPDLRGDVPDPAARDRPRNLLPADSRRNVGFGMAAGDGDSSADRLEARRTRSRSDCQGPIHWSTCRFG